MLILDNHEEHNCPEKSFDADLLSHLMLPLKVHTLNLTLISVARIQMDSQLKPEA
jgi:hypothetical protein